MDQQLAATAQTSSPQPDTRGETQQNTAGRTPNRGNRPNPRTKHDTPNPQQKKHRKKTLNQRYSHQQRCVQQHHPTRHGAPSRTRRIPAHATHPDLAPRRGSCCTPPADTRCPARLLCDRRESVGTRLKLSPSDKLRWAC